MLRTFSPASNFFSPENLFLYPKCSVVDPERVFPDLNPQNCQKGHFLVPAAHETKVIVSLFPHIYLLYHLPRQGLCSYRYRWHTTEALPAAHWKNLIFLSIQYIQPQTTVCHNLFHQFFETRLNESRFRPRFFYEKNLKIFLKVEKGIC